jgi:hypothetical protein
MHAAPQDTAPVDVRAIRRHFTFPELGRIVTNINLDGRDPVAVAEALNRAGVEARAGCHCATLAHHALGLSPPASCRLSFYLYNTPDEIDQAVAEVAAIAAGREAPRARWYRLRDREPRPRFARWPAPAAPRSPMTRRMASIPSTTGSRGHPPA